VSYSKPNRIKYDFPVHTWTGSETFSVQGPKGKSGRLYDYGVYGVTTAFAGGTTTPVMSVGTPSDADAYGEEFDFGTLADNSGMSVRSTYAPSHATFDDYILAGDIPKDQEVVVTCTAASGGGAAGVSTPFVIIDWSD
jgi:hypothetical protein